MDCTRQPTRDAQMNDSEDDRSAGPEGERLQKVLARVGLGSRRSCEELIAAGRVRVNGGLAHLGQRVDAEADLVELDDVPVPARSGLVHYLLNKPREWSRPRAIPGDGQP